MSYKNIAKNETPGLLTIFVETLTGTTFEVKVSPQDKVKSIKSKIQKVEGIPVSHQHLLYKSQELEDSSCVSEPSVALYDCATVKLVLSMRGGPISLVHQAVPLNRAVLRNIVKLNRESLLEDLPSGCKMAILVFKVGDQLNLLEVMEDPDNMSDPMSNIKESLSMDSLLEGESSKIIEENSVTMEKLCDLKERMEKLSLQRKSSKTGCKKKEVNSTPNVSRPSASGTSVKLPPVGEAHGEMFKSRSDFSQVPILPDIIRQPLTNTSRDLEFLNLIDYAASSSMCTSVRPKTCPASLTESQIYDMFSENDCQNSLQISQDHFRSCVSACSSKLHHEWGVGSVNILPPISTLPDVLKNHRPLSDCEPINPQTSAMSSVDGLHRQCLTGEKNISKCESRSLQTAGPLVERLNLQFRKIFHDTDSELISSKVAVPTVENQNVLHGNLDEQKETVSSELRNPQTGVPMIERLNLYEENNRKDSETVKSKHRNMFSRPFIEESTPQRNLNNTKIPSITNQSRNLNTNVPSIKKVSLRQKNVNSSFKYRQNLMKESERPDTSESMFLTKSISNLESAHSSLASSQFTPSSSYELFPKNTTSLIMPPTELPYCELLSSNIKNNLLEPVVESQKVHFEKKNRLRCSECKKRLSLTNTFECRCGFTFCSCHRYSETHHCTYDFKKESRKMLELANPSVVAPKLPKI